MLCLCKLAMLKSWIGCDYHRPENSVSDYYGSDSLRFVIEDSKGGISNEVTLSITITEVDDSPVANNDSFEFIPGSVTLLDVLLNDSNSDAGNGLNIVSYSQHNRA